ncbi:hypothetical protein EI74_0080 [Mycoplasma testudineum]|uniref:Uncharacterized protein n=1 Tax=Mycoplasma testudineum TaxID=244584 RepID=A0A4R6IGX6_9MOLU|nr:hypothetical protein [Mycoplasma testudineum]TDO21061.1 hypothetical protein EI74_0080 [Mycoplasma testudineum]
MKLIIIDGISANVVISVTKLLVKISIDNATIANTPKTINIIHCAFIIIL